MCRYCGNFGPFLGAKFGFNNFSCVKNALSVEQVGWIHILQLCTNVIFLSPPQSDFNGFKIINGLKMCSLYQICSHHLSASYMETDKRLGNREIRQFVMGLEGGGGMG